MVKKSVHLPQDLITNILLRLPVKTILRCRCVSKSWLSIISNPNFATSHFQLSTSPTHRLLYLVSIPPKSITVDFNASLHDDSFYSSLRIDFLDLYYVEIGGSCRGFLFLHYEYHKNLYIWNPTTGVHKQIPASPITISSNRNKYVFMYGFAYDSSTDDYLVFLGFYEHDLDHYPVSNSIELEIFSLRANEWKQFEGGSYLPYMSTSPCERGHKRVGLFLNGVVHWLVRNHVTSKNVIIAFDLKERRMSEIALPDDFDSNYTPRKFDLLVVGGLVNAWTVECYTVKMWVMQEYGVHSSWTKTIEISMHSDYVPNYLLCFTNNGDIVGTNGYSGLVKINDKGQLLEDHSYHDGYSGRSQMIVYTESLLSLPYGFKEQD